MIAFENLKIVDRDHDRDCKKLTGSENFTGIYRNLQIREIQKKE